jgi:hypothetical protein
LIRIRILTILNNNRLSSKRIGLLERGKKGISLVLFTIFYFIGVNNCIDKFSSLNLSKFRNIYFRICHVRSAYLCVLQFLWLGMLKILTLVGQLFNFRLVVLEDC